MTEPVDANKIKEQVKAFITENFLMGGGFEAIADDESLLENGIVDSTGVLELVTFTEETFDIEVDDEEMVPDNLDSLNKLAAFIHKKMQA